LKENGQNGVKAPKGNTRNLERENAKCGKHKTEKSPQIECRRSNLEHIE